MQDLILIHVLTFGQLHHYTSDRGVAFLYSAHDDTISPTPPAWVDRSVVNFLLHGDRNTWRHGAQCRTDHALYTAKPVDSVTALRTLDYCNHRKDSACPTSSFSPSFSRPSSPPSARPRLTQSL